MWHKVEKDRGQVQGQRTSSIQGVWALGWGKGTCLCKPSVLRHAAPGQLRPRCGETTGRDPGAAHRREGLS